jgi:nucleoside-diphosphate-sugar epimerase
MKILMTGSTGFIGKTVLKKISHCHSVTTITRKDSLTECAEANINLNYHCDKFPSFKGFDMLMHFAWSNMRDVDHPDHFDEALHSYKLIEKAIYDGVRKIIVIGSCYEFGKVYGPMSSKCPTNPQTAYAHAKVLLHAKLSNLKARADFQLGWIRLFYVYDPSSRANNVVGLLNQFIDRGDRIFPMSGGEQLFDYITTEELASKISNFCNRSNLDGVYHAATGSPISLRRLLEAHIKKSGANIKLKIGFYPYRKVDSLAIWSEVDDNLI